MDPNRALSDLIAWARTRGRSPHGAPYDGEAARTLLALDSWLSRGGFLPGRWQQPPTEQPEQPISTSEFEKLPGHLPQAWLNYPQPGPTMAPPGPTLPQEPRK